MGKLIIHFRSLVINFGPTSALLLLSQAISAFSLSLLPLLGLRVSDIYAIAVQTGTGPYNGLVLGVVYLLVIGRPSFSDWRLVNFSVILFSICLTAYSTYSALKNPHVGGISRSEIVGIILLFGAGGLALGLASVSGVRQACLGRPWYLAGVTMLPNLSMSGATGISFLLHSRYSGLSVAPAAAWSCGAALTAAILLSRKIPMVSKTVSEGPSETRANKALHVAGLIIGLVTSTVLPIGFVTAAGKLSSGSATILFLANRIGSAIVGVFVNAVLMVKINWADPGKLSTRYSFAFPVLSSTLILLGLTLHSSLHAATTSYIVIALSWLLITCSTPILLREANVRRLGAVLTIKSIIDLTASTCALVAFQKHPSATGFFGASMISQGITCAVCGSAFKDKKLVIASSAGLILSTFILLRGW